MIISVIKGKISMVWRLLIMYILILGNLYSAENNINSTKNVLNDDTTTVEMPANVDNSVNKSNPLSVDTSNIDDEFSDTSIGTNDTEFDMNADGTVDDQSVLSGMSDKNGEQIVPSNKEESSKLTATSSSNDQQITDNQVANNDNDSNQDPQNQDVKSEKNEAEDEQVEAEDEQVEAEDEQVSKQLESYNSMTSWILENTDRFQDIIEDTARVTHTKWYSVDNSKQSEDSSSSNSVLYEVGIGDTLYSISKKFNVSVEDLMEWNNLTDKTIVIGSRLLIWKNGIPDKESKTSNKQQVLSDVPVYRYYKIKAGDTLSKIALQYNMTVKNLIELNNFSNDVVIYIDQIIKVKSNYVDVQKQKQTAIVQDGFIWPVVGRVIIPFGIQENGEVNEGINIRANANTPVKSVQDGVVVYVGNDLKNFGNLIIVQHDKNWVSVYAHLKNINVTRGQSVIKGAILAKIGDSGFVKSSQLHFELRYNVQPMDPLNYLSSYR